MLQALDACAAASSNGGGGQAAGDEGQAEAPWSHYMYTQVSVGAVGGVAGHSYRLPTRRALCLATELRRWILSAPRAARRWTS